MQRLEQQAQAVAAKDVTAKLKEKVLFVRCGSFLSEVLLDSRRSLKFSNRLEVNRIVVQFQKNHIF